MMLLRAADLTTLEETDEINANFVKLFFQIFQEVKPQLLTIITKQKESWEMEEIQKIEKIGYLG